MNRELLFRGFHECTDGKTVIKVDGKKKRGEWVYGFYTYCTDGDKLSHRIYISFAESYGNEILCPIWFEVIPQTVGQFIGLTDKNDKRIFEHDIMTEKCFNGTIKIIFGDGEFYGDGGTYGRRISSLYEDEICGNVWENSNLIGGNENA